jgi:two-component system, OmpR family, sensor kinase
MRRSRHLYLKIYVAFVAILLGSLVTAAIVRVSFEKDFDRYPQLAQGIAELLAEQLPVQKGAQLDAALEHAADLMGINLALWASDGGVLARTSELPVGTLEQEHGFHRIEPHGMVVPLSDGRRLGVFFHHAPSHAKFLLWLALFAAILAIGCYPVARGITRRLERLRAAADSWGQGALATRAPVEGGDEIAQLSRTFNQAAERIQTLVAQQKRVLASASHELRSPLTRMQMALALLDDAAPQRRAELVSALEREVGELNRLIEDFLTAAKADHASARGVVELDRIIVQECQRLSISDVRVSNLSLRGSEASLRSLVRNLLENAQRHGGGSEVQVSLERSIGRCVVCVEDKGPGISAGEAERIFEPFYRPQGHNEGLHGGVGLGLALVREIAEAHHGTAHYEARDGGGSRFIVVLPIGA